jgi:hypothetical protein
MKQKIISCGIGYICILLFLINITGCITSDTDNNGDNNSADVILADVITNFDWSEDLGGFLDATFDLQNVGNESAQNITIDLFITDQDEYTEFDTTLSITSNLEIGQTKTRNFLLDFEGNDTLLNADITVRWDGGSNTYSYQWS